MELKNHLEKNGITITAFARMLSEKCGKVVSRDAVYQWIRGIRPIPIQYGSPIEEITGGELSRKKMFPSNWNVIWPDLIESSAGKKRATPRKPAKEGA